MRASGGNQLVPLVLLVQLVLLFQLVPRSSFMLGSGCFIAQPDSVRVAHTCVQTGGDVTRASALLALCGPQQEFLSSMKGLILIIRCSWHLQQLENSLNEFGEPWKLNPGDGAFYGPKVTPFPHKSVQGRAQKVLGALERSDVLLCAAAD